MLIQTIAQFRFTTLVLLASLALSLGYSEFAKPLPHLGDYRGDSPEFIGQIELPDDVRGAKPFITRVSVWTKDCEVPDHWDGYYNRNGNVICVKPEVWKDQDLRTYQVMAHEIAHAGQIRMDEINEADYQHTHDDDHFALTYRVMEEMLVNEAGMSRARAVITTNSIKLVLTPAARLSDKL